MILRSAIVIRLILQTALLLLVMGAILFGAGGAWQWPQAWFFLGEFAISASAVSLWLAKHDPALLEQRLSSPVQRNQEPWDRIFMLFICVGFFGWLALMAMDARRFLWSHVPLWAQFLGAVLIALSMGLNWLTFRFNSFAVPQARVQPERGQRVATEGPYRFVRHPMYSGALLLFLGVPLLLGSWWGLAFALVLTVGLGLRAVREEGMLRRELAGYDEYARKVRFRLIPGLW
jgi:protein-S-isoprenylcysteine O-methyltransferase Ste14